MTHERPDPDQLLQRVNAEEERRTRAKLKIFFGFAPGVGKTYRMLQMARELSEQGVDVLVALLETHGRKDTAALLDGLAVLPRRAYEHRGVRVEELDLEGVLQRRPALVLVDELAHQNAAGMRHPKRCQDVLELLDAGIDVFTTLNVQHIESLNDVIAQITHVRVRETVPDALLERADEVELVDISPEELLARLREGKVYLPEQAQRAAAHFFRHGNLLALRELALRRTAAHVEANVLAYRNEHAVAATWPTSERVLVSVSAAPASAKVVRAAKRMAAGMNADFLAAWVATTSRPPLPDAQAKKLEENLALAESLGARVVRLSGSDVATPLLRYARAQNVTRLVIGKPAHARLYDRLRGSLLDAVVRASGDIDVHVISGDAAEAVRAVASDESPSGPPSPRGFLLAAATVGVVTAAGALLRRLFGIPDVEMLYLLGVTLTALRFGMGPSLFAAALSVAAYDFFFVPPLHTFAVGDARHLLTFLMLFLSGTFMSALTTRLKRQEQEALAREARAAALHRLSRELGALLDPARAAEVVTRLACESFAADAAVLTPDASGELQCIASSSAQVALAGNDLGVAKWVFTHGRTAGVGTDTLPGARVICAELRVGPSQLGVLGVVPRDGCAMGTEQRAFLEAFCRQAAFAFERARLAEQARVLDLRAKTEELRSTLLSTVSHDLRTPLAAITGAATTLRVSAVPAATRDELVDTICDEAEHMERLVTNLLDMTRLETGGIAPKREWVPADELVGAALSRLEALLARRKVDVTLAPDLPMIWADPVLMQQVLLNLLENAAKYTPPESPLDIAVRAEGGLILLDIADRGPGVPEGSEERIFEKFYRGSHAGKPGVGLGLAIARGIIAAHGGTLRALPRPGGGALFRIALPRPEGAPDPSAGASP
ncbi:MAG: hypothetical protein RL385_55 [Pseudomonadota bacterium]|jgi:two-component system sensor histidine kinase KdpD